MCTNLLGQRLVGEFWILRLGKSHKASQVKAFAHEIYSNIIIKMDDAVKALEREFKRVTNDLEYATHCFETAFKR